MLSTRGEIAWAAVVAGLAGGVAPGAASAEPGDFEVLQWFPAPMTSPDGLEWVDGALFTTECTSEDIFEVAPAGGAVLRRFTLPGAFIDHLAWDGAYLWGNDHHAEGRFHQVDIDAEKVVTTLSVPFSPMGITWDGSHLWSMDAGTGEVHRVDPETGEIVRTLLAPGDNVCGLGWDGVCLWISDLTDGLYYLIDPESGEVQATLDPPGGPGKLFTGFSWDGSTIWVADENPSDPRIYQLDVEFPATGPCARSVGGDDPDAGDEADIGADAPDAGGDASNGEAGEGGGGSRDSGCSVAPGRTSPPWPLILALLVVVAVARVRRRTVAGQ